MDWFIVIKQQKKYSYVYADSNFPALNLSSNLLSSTTAGAVALTIGAAMTQSYTMFNDQPPVHGASGGVSTL